MSSILIYVKYTRLLAHKATGPVLIRTNNRVCTGRNNIDQFVSNALNYYDLQCSHDQPPYYQYDSHKLPKIRTYSSFNPSKPKVHDAQKIKRLLKVQCGKQQHHQKRSKVICMKHFLIKRNRHTSKDLVTCRVTRKISHIHRCEFTRFQK